METGRTADLTPWTIGMRERWLRKHRGSYPVYVHEEDQHVAGWVSLSPWREGRAAVSSVAEVSYYVDKTYRGRGIGGALLDYAIEMSPELGKKTLIAIVVGGNQPSIGLLTSRDFSLWGRLPLVVETARWTRDHLIFGRHLCGAGEP